MSRKTVTSVGVLLLTVAAACSTGRNAADEQKAQPIPGGPEATITIFPVTLCVTGPVDRTEHHRAFADAYARGFREKGREFADTLGLLLQEQGYDNFQVVDAAFQFPTDKAARKERAAAFGQFVGELDLKTDYALCTEFTLHMARSGFEEVYSAIVDANGGIVWEDSQRRGAGTELGCLELACRRLTPAMGLDSLPRKELGEDKKQMLRELRAKEPPSHSEFEAMEKRLEAMNQTGAAARVLVYPARVGGDHTDESSATRLAQLVNDAGLWQASVASTGPVLEGEGWPNEMHVLWLFARAVKEYVREHPVDSDYVLFADYWFNPRGQVWAVHFVVCDRAGDWVIVDLQNSHQEDFQRVKPKDLADCDRLVLERLKAELR